MQGVARAAYLRASQLQCGRAKTLYIDFEDNGRRPRLPDCWRSALTPTRSPGASTTSVPTSRSPDAAGREAVGGSWSRPPALAVS